MNSRIEISIAVKPRLRTCSKSFKWTISTKQEIASLCQKWGVLLLVDCTQSLGYLPMDVEKIPIDFLAGTGHKSLLGPTAVGFLYVKNSEKVASLMQGGSGGSTSISPYHPNIMPYKFEAETLNITAIAGLNGSLKYLKKKGTLEIKQKAISFLMRAYHGLAQLPEVTIYGNFSKATDIPILSFNLAYSIPNERDVRIFQRRIRTSRYFLRKKPSFKMELMASHAHVQPMLSEYDVALRPFVPDATRPSEDVLAMRASILANLSSVFM